MSNSSYLIHQLIDLAFQEDIGPGDVTTEYLIDSHAEGVGRIIAKEPLVIAGLDIAGIVFRHLDSTVQCRTRFHDGDCIDKETQVLEIVGSLQALLMGERTALNFLQRLSGIATHVRAHVDQMKAPHVRLVDTRKTTPGWRVLEKYAVRVGGAHNHRMGLYDGVLIKDNHIAVCGGIEAAVMRIRRAVHHLVKVEVEVSDMIQVAEAVRAGADVIMLDNMNFEQIEEAVTYINGRALVEVSGGVTKGNLEALAHTGVDIISVGALTHSARSVDLSMQIVPKKETRESYSMVQPD